MNASIIKKAIEDNLVKYYDDLDDIDVYVHLRKYGKHKLNEIEVESRYGDYILSVIDIPSYCGGMFVGWVQDFICEHSPEQFKEMLEDIAESDTEGLLYIAIITSSVKKRLERVGMKIRTLDKFENPNTGNEFLLVKFILPEYDDE